MFMKLDNTVPSELNAVVVLLAHRLTLYMYTVCIIGVQAEKIGHFFAY